MKIRAKMQLENVFAQQWGGYKVVFRCIYDSTIPEDQKFCKATPSGIAEFQIDNPEVTKNLVIGKYYYFDMTPVEPVAEKTSLQPQWA